MSPFSSGRNALYTVLYIIISVLFRRPCTGGNATGLNRVGTQPLDPYQQWELNSDKQGGGGGNLYNIGATRCAEISLGTRWTRAGEPAPDDTVSEVAINRLDC
jgi:hypothetical protein